MIEPKQLQLQISPELAADPEKLHLHIARELNQSPDSFEFVWHKRSIDARKRDIKINATLHVYPKGEVPVKPATFHPKNVSKATPVYIIGAGPAGLYAALRALELGLKPIVIERGKDVRARRRDLAILNKEQLVNPESNYCFGEGGAGTYSDGKLYTRSKKRGDVLKTLEWLVHFGAPQDILVDAHPHIGTNKLPQLIVAMRDCIIEYGGEVRFETKLTDLFIEQQQVVGIEINGNQRIDCSNVILATGHSARDIFYLLHDRGVKLLAKPFALGVRIEHTQELIDTIQYHGRLNDEFLPPASYALVTQVEDKGVYSFCMCPGGIIAPCSTAEGEVVTNGWSPSKRNNITSNSGIVVSVEPEELPNYTPDNPFVCLEFQQKVEQTCWEAAGKTQRVPAQRLIDFIDRKKSKDFPRTSYQPGIVSVDLNTVLPDFIARRLRKAFVDFDRKMRGYLTNDAVLHAPESRTSSPVSIPRNSETCEHIEIAGLYPCAEGAGYAGGIVSAAIDGMKCMDAIAEKLNPKET
ncbi:MAG: FAD-binding protein [Candidatus Fluviicola riflensis]|nr:MAG: FAD-binding protein [Candidatus Fluviicola riflensis]OGS75868.1 MAG: FAD-binding protein [Candidatus Fluviicola riflensis]OGS83548.1 MAG: FAD-binding protein [Fluviicola sp. RIFCSPHIGHO2_01_FULL_43_53]OGS85687.1 MAG: FAD-binding protein [Fluviicola sp. RIFCSPHIGHO2_12_FULL_43_24]